MRLWGRAAPWLPLMRELSAARLTEGESPERQALFLVSPSVKTFGFATSLVRGRHKDAHSRANPSLPPDGVEDRNRYNFKKRPGRLSRALFAGVPKVGIALF